MVLKACLRCALVFARIGIEELARYWPSGPSGQDIFDDVAVNIGQSEVAALKAVGQARVIEAEQVQQRRIEVMDVHGIYHGIET